MKKEEEINKILKESSKGIEVPVSLHPEKVLDKVEKVENIKSKQNRYRIYKWAGTLVAVICIAIGFTTASMNLNEKENLNVIGGNTQEEELATVENYDVIYQALVDEEKNRAKGSSFNDKVTENDMVAQLETGTDSGTNESSKDYTDTNVQVEGIDEADIAKTDGTYLYTLKKESDLQNVICIIEANQGAMKTVSKITVDKENYDIKEFYVDNNQLIVIGEKGVLRSDVNKKYRHDYEYNYLPYKSLETYVTIYDITEKKVPKKQSEYQQSGAYTSSRKVKEVLYIFSEFTPNIGEKKKKKENYIPKINGNILECEDIYFEDKAEDFNSVVIASVSLKEPGKVINKKAIYGNNSEFYVSDSNIYVYQEKNKSTKGWYKRQTKITKFSYKDGEIKGKSNCLIDGGIQDTFSLNEKDDYLRIVTTCSEWNLFMDGGNKVSNSLYVLNSKMKVVGEITDLAPGESIKSARFLGDMGYFVTFRQTDPLFSVDLSNPKKPKILGELKVTGFSDYLHFWDKDLLLGIGYEADQMGRVKGIKVSMFDVSNPKDVKEVDREVFLSEENSEYSSRYLCNALDDYKEVMAQIDKNRFGFTLGRYECGVLQDYFSYDYNYTIFSYDKEKGFSYKELPILDKGNTSRTRGMMIGNYLYVVNQCESIVSFEQMENGNWKELSTLKLN